MTALLLLYLAASAGLGAPWWLLLIPGLALLSAARARQAGPSLPDEHVATIFVRKGRLVLRRRRAS